MSETEEFRQITAWIREMFPWLFDAMLHGKNKHSHTFKQPSGPFWAYSWGSVFCLSVSPAVQLCLDPTYGDSPWLRFNLVTVFLKLLTSICRPARGWNLHKNLCHLYISFCNQPALICSSLSLYHNTPFNSSAVETRNIWHYLRGGGNEKKPADLDRPWGLSLVEILWADSHAHSCSE